MKTLYHRTMGGKIKIWSVWIEPDGISVTREWGVQGGQMQKTSDTKESRGKAGTLAYKSPEQVAQEAYERLIDMKTKEGYVSDITMVRKTNEATSLDAKMLETGQPPDSFAPAKPMDLEPAQLNRWRLDNLTVATRKRDGQRVFIIVNANKDVRVWSRKMEELTYNVSHLLDVFKRLPPRTLLDAELILDVNGTDDFRTLGSVTRALPERGLFAAKGLPVKFYIFDVLYYQGRAVFSYPYKIRRELLNRSILEQSYVQIAPVLTVANPFLVAQELKWEGLVFWAINQPTVVRFDGKPERTGCAKWKPVQERDFIATGFLYGTGRNSNVMGKLTLCDVTVDGHFRNIGRVGSGFDDATREQALKWEYPCVVSVKFDKQEPDSGALRFPVFMRKHSDKTVEEVIANATR